MFIRLFNLVGHISQKGWHGTIGLIKRLLEDRRVRFTIIGGCATLNYYLFALLFVYALHFSVFLSNGAAYLLGFAVSYLGQSLWTFQADGKHGKMLIRFALTQLMGLGINYCIIGFCIHLGLPYPIAMIIAICAVPVFVYLVCKYWVFRKKNQESA